MTQTSDTTRWDAIQVGDALPPLTLPVITRDTLALYARASNDRNPLHTDPEAARRGGLPDVIAHGMLSMAWLGRLLTGWADVRQLRAFEARFTGMTPLGGQVSCGGQVVDKFVSEAGERCVRLEIATRTQDGEAKLIGSAVVAIGD